MQNGGAFAKIYLLFKKACYLYIQARKSTFYMFDIQSIGKARKNIVCFGQKHSMFRGKT